ncbi:thiamine pyrophosphate-binding protein [Bradyrhizobium sp. LA7.1]|uniref:thiamine pyrophosphate-binding protein n=1 Tax=Bradyrhizobium sp. LA7.1 TaxID=3156324 RepID=UPI0033972C45
MSNALTIRSVPVWKEVARAIVAMGVKRCFGLVGGANFKVTHALTELGVQFIAARHEGNAVTMADASARLSRELTVASVTAGPGLTNAITGIAESAKSNTSLLVIAGDVAKGDGRSSFAMKQSDLVRSVGAVWCQIDTPATAAEDTLRVAAQALHERQTVVLSLPIDVQEVLVEQKPLKTIPPTALKTQLPSNTNEIERVVDVIHASRRPLILAGRGAILADAEPALTALGDRIGALFATTLQAHGMFADHPGALGISGGFSSPAATELISKSDLILAFGAGLNAWTTKKARLVSPDAIIVQVDVDPRRLGYHHPVQLEIVGDASAVASAVLNGLNRKGYFPSCRDNWQSADALKIISSGNNHCAQYEDTSCLEYLDPRTLSKAVDEILPPDRIVVCDGGHFIGWPARYLRIADQRSWCVPIAFQSIGLGLAAAIGASVTYAGRLVVLAAGDGGFLMSLADLETAVRLNRRICILVYNDHAYGAEVHHFAPMNYSTKIVQFPDTSFAEIARGFGAKGIEVRTLADLAPLKEWIAEGSPGVFLVDGKINPNLEADWYREAVAPSNL